MSPRAASLTVTATGLPTVNAHQRPPARLDSADEADARRLQAALLEPRTARPLPLLQRLLGAAWRWL